MTIILFSNQTANAQSLPFKLDHSYGYGGKLKTPKIKVFGVMGSCTLDLKIKALNGSFNSTGDEVSEGLHPMIYMDIDDTLRLDYIASGGSSVNVEIDGCRFL